MRIRSVKLEGWWKKSPGCRMKKIDPRKNARITPSHIKILPEGWNIHPVDSRFVRNPNDQIVFDRNECVDGRKIQNGTDLCRAQTMRKTKKCTFALCSCSIAVFHSFAVTPWTNISQWTNISEKSERAKERKGKKTNTDQYTVYRMASSHRSVTIRL